MAYMGNSPCGGSSSGTGGDVDTGGGIAWESINTSMTIETNVGYLVDTTANSVTLLFPVEPDIGDIIEIIDQKNNFAINNCILDPNADPINGSGALIHLDNLGFIYTLIFVNGSLGWKLIKIQNKILQPITSVHGLNSFSGGSVAKTIPHNLGSTPKVNITAGADPGGYLGEVWTTSDMSNIYVYNSGSATVNFYWTATID